MPECGSGDGGSNPSPGTSLRAKALRLAGQSLSQRLSAVALAKADARKNIFWTFRCRSRLARHVAGAIAIQIHPALSNPASCMVGAIGQGGWIDKHSESSA